MPRSLASSPRDSPQGVERLAMIAPGMPPRVVGLQDGRADPVEVAPALAAGRLRGRQRPLPVLPAAGVLLLKVVEIVHQAGQRAMAGLDRVRSEAHGQHEHTAAGAEVHLARERDVAVLGPIVLPGQPLVPGQVLPAVGRPDITGRSLEPGGRAGQGQGLVVAAARTASALPNARRATRCCSPPGSPDEEPRARRDDSRPAPLRAA